MYPELDDLFAIDDRYPMETPIAQSMTVERQGRNTLPTPELDSAADLGQNPQSAIIAGVPGAGKGIFVSNALREMKVRNPHVKIFAIDPKNDPKETGYWSVVDVLWRLRFKDSSSEAAAEWYMARMEEFKAYPGPKLLVSDETSMVLTVMQLAKIYDEEELSNGKIQRTRKNLMGEFKKALIELSAMGDSDEHFVWMVCQVINCDDLGITGGIRSIFRAIALVSPKNRNAVSTFFSTGFVPLPPGGKDALYRMMDTSPCNRAFYDGKKDKWLPTPLWTNHSGYNRDTRTVETKPMYSSACPSPGLDPWGEPAIATPQHTAFEASIEPVMGAV
jgi:hypothetical protein